MTPISNPDRLAYSSAVRPDPTPGCRRWSDADEINRPRGCDRPAVNDAPDITPTRRGYRLTVLRDNLVAARAGASSDSVRVARRRLDLALARRAADRRDADLRFALLYIAPRLLPRVRSAQSVIGAGFAAARAVVTYARNLVALARAAVSAPWVRFSRTRACRRPLPDLTPFFLASCPPPPTVLINFDLCSWWSGLTALARFDLSYVGRLSPS